MIALHILFSILKAVGILLLVLLGLLIIMLLALLFCPVGYYAGGKKDGCFCEGEAGISWLFHLVSVKIGYAGRDKEIHYSVRILGIPLEKVMKFFADRKEKQKKRAEEKTKAKTGLETQAEVRAETGSETQAEAQAETEPETQAEPKVMSGQKAETKTETASEIKPETSSESEVGTDNKLPEQKSEAEAENPKQPEKSENPEKEEKPQKAAASAGQDVRLPEQKRRKRKAFVRSLKEKIGKITAFIRKLCGIPGKILNALKNFGLTVRKICGRIEQIREFLESEHFTNAKKLVFGETRKIFRHLKPKKVRGYLKFGMEDPCVTGEILAAAGIFYPLYGEYLTIEPYFDQNILEGNIYMRGRIYGIFFVVTAWKLFWNADIRYIVKKFKQQ